MTQPYVIGEAVGKRTRNSKHFLRSDGSYQAIISMVDQHFADSAGNWHNVDTALIDEGDFDTQEDSGLPVAAHIRAAFQARAAEIRALKRGGGVDRDRTDWRALRVAHDVTLPKNLKRGYSIGYGADRLTFVPVGASPSRGQCSPSDSATVEYQDVWPLTDVLLTVTASGLKETLVVKAPGGPDTYSTEVQGPLADDLTSGSLRVRRAWLEDAAGTRRDVPTLRAERNGKVYLDLMPDLSGLVYPVRIDPTVTAAASGVDVFVQSSAPNTSFDESTLRALGSSSGEQWDAFLSFNLPDVPPSSVTAGLLHVYLRYVPSGSSYVRWGAATGAWSETTTWNTKPARSATSYYQPVDAAYQWFEINVAASIIQGWMAGANHGLHFWNNASTYREVEFDSSEGINPPYLEITYTNAPPGAPAVTSPNGGETWNAEHTITWTAATDPDGDALQYHIQLSTNNGGSWSDVVALAMAGATSYTYDFSGVAESATCLIRIQAYDGTSYGAWDVSDGVFTIAHNVAPGKPTNLSPSSGAAVDRAAVQRLSWTKNDSNSSDPQSKFDLQWSDDGGSTWNTVSQETTNEYWDAPGDTFPHGDIVWKVRTYDQAGLSGPYADQVMFSAGDKPTTATIVTPSDGSTVGTATPTFQWSNAGQTGYQALAVSAAGATLWNSGTVISANKATTVGAPLADGTTPTLKVRYYHTDGVWSDYATSGISVVYTPPDTPLLTLTVMASYITIAIDNGSTTISYNDLYRRIQGDTDWVRIAANLAQDAEYRDYTVASGTAYEYKVIAYAPNGTMAESATSTATLTMAGGGIWLHDPLDADGTVHRFEDRTSFNDDRRAVMETFEFEGRSAPVVWFNPNMETRQFRARLALRSDTSDSTLLDGFFTRRRAFCFRDWKGRKAFVVMPTRPHEDTLWGGYAEVELIVVDYDEEV